MRCSNSQKIWKIIHNAGEFSPIASILSRYDELHLSSAIIFCPHCFRLFRNLHVWQMGRLLGRQACDWPLLSHRFPPWPSAATSWMRATTPAAPTSTAATPSFAGASTASAQTSRRASASCPKWKVGSASSNTSSHNSTTHFSHSSEVTCHQNHLIVCAVR